MRRHIGHYLFLLRRWCQKAGPRIRALARVLGPTVSVLVALERLVELARHTGLL